ncbi:MAG: hypothetical protein Q9168_007785 [Polycauliona sp. 1 TL-2023]
MDVAASAVALIEAAHKLYEYGNDVVHARKEQKTILNSLQGIADVLNAIKDREALARNSPNDKWYQGLLALNTSATTNASGKSFVPDPARKGDGALVRLRKTFEFLELDLKPKHGLAGIRQRWVWTHDKKKINDLVTRLDQLKGHVDSVLSQDAFQLSADTNQRVQDVQRTGADTNHRLQDVQQTNAATSITIEDTNSRIKRMESAGVLKEQREERRDIIEWLSPLQFLRRQSDILNGKIPMGEKFLESDEFKAWSEGRPWILFGYGRPGSGKTVLSAIVVDRLRKSMKPLGVPVLCLYLNYKERNQTIPNLIGSLLKQLIQFEDDNFRSPRVRKLFREAAREASPLLDDLYEALRAEIMTFPRYG